MHIQSPSHDKFQSRSHKCIFVGYPFSKDGWRVFDLESNKFFNSRDVYFMKIFFHVSMKTTPVSTPLWQSTPDLSSSNNSPLDSPSSSRPIPPQPNPNLKPIILQALDRFVCGPIPLQPHHRLPPLDLRSGPRHQQSLLGCLRNIH